MKAIFTFLICFSIFSNTAFSQKLKTDYLQVEYTGLPARPLSKEFKTYSVSFTDPYAVMKTANLNPESLAKSHLSLDGFKALPIGGDFHININIGQYILIGHETKEESEKKTRKVTPKKETTSTTASKPANTPARVAKKTETKKTAATPEKSNTSTKTQTTETYYVTTFYKSINYRLPISYVVLDYKGNKIKEGILIKGDKKLTYAYGKKSSDPHQLEENFKKNFDAVTAGMVNNSITNNVKSLGGWIKTNYDFQKLSQKIYLYRLGKKSDGADEFNAAFEKVKNAFAKMKADQSIDPLRSEVKPAIDTWLKFAEQYPIKKKKGLKAKRACLHNIIYTYYYLDDLDTAAKYANQYIELGKKERPMKRFLESVQKTKGLMRKNNVKNRHIDRDLENYVEREPMPVASPANQSMASPTSVATPKDAITYDGFMIDKKGTRIKGKFIISNNDKNELEFGKLGNIEFRWNKNNIPQVSHLNPNNIKSFGFNKRNFNCQAYQTALEKDGSKIKIMECLFDSDLIKVFKFYPYDQGSTNNKTEISLQRKTDKLPVSTVGDDFLIFKRGLSEFFKDCSDLSELALGGEFERNEVDIVRAAKAYTQYCK